MNETINFETVLAFSGAAFTCAGVSAFIGYGLYKCYQSNAHERHQRIIYSSSVPRNIAANEQELRDLSAVVVMEQPRNNPTNLTSEPLDVRFPTRHFYQ